MSAAAAKNDTSAVKSIEEEGSAVGWCCVRRAQRSCVSALGRGKNTANLCKPLTIVGQQLWVQYSRVHDNAPFSDAARGHIFQAESGAHMMCGAAGAAVRRRARRRAPTSAHVPLVEPAVALVEAR